MSEIHNRIRVVARIIVDRVDHHGQVLGQFYQVIEDHRAQAEAADLINIVDHQRIRIRP